jgi:YkoY family integral membrane protein
MNWDAIGHDLAIVLTLLLLEAVLSFDNAAILAAMVRRLPPKDRRKALLYGLGGAYILRITAILLASFLIETPSLKILGGAYLLFIAVRHFIRFARHREDGHKAHEVKPGLLARWGVPALVSIIVQIELIDLAFAVDQVIVAVAFTDEILLIVIASVIGILFLRLAAAVIARVMDWLPALEHMAYVAVGYVGFKLILLHEFFAVGWTQGPTTADGLRTSIEGGTCRVPFIPIEHEVALGARPGCEIPTAVSVGITLSLFLVPILLKLLFGRRGLPPKEPDPETTVPPATSAPETQG